MVRVKYRDVPKNLENMTKPSDNVDSRSSISQSITVTEHYELDINRLIPYKKQAREEFDEEEIKKLSESIIRHGVRQPLTVIQSDTEDKYEVVSGERRLRAAYLAGLNKVPCIIIQNTSLAEEIAVVENIMREDLHPVELSKAFASLIENNKELKQGEVARRIGVSKYYFSETLKYNTLPSNVKKHLLENDIKDRETIRQLLRSQNPMKILENRKKSKTTSQNTLASKSVLRIFLKDGNVHFQSNGLKFLSQEQKSIILNKIKKDLE